MQDFRRTLKISSLPFIWVWRLLLVTSYIRILTYNFYNPCQQSKESRPFFTHQASLIPTGVLFLDSVAPSLNRNTSSPQSMAYKYICYFWFCDPRHTRDFWNLKGPWLYPQFYLVPSRTLFISLIVPVLLPPRIFDGFGYSRIVSIRPGSLTPYFSFVVLYDLLCIFSSLN